MNLTFAPLITTDRLTLRMPVLADFEHHAAFHASRRAEWEGGVKPRKEAWNIWASAVANWPLRGYGPFSVDVDGLFIGEVGIFHPDNFPGPELGWMVVPAAEGSSLAFQATSAVLNWVKSALAWPQIDSVIDARNTRSIALARRLGGVSVSDVAGIGPEDQAFRYHLAGVPA